MRRLSGIALDPPSSAAASAVGRSSGAGSRSGGIFDRLHLEMEENNLDIYKAGPWNAGLAPFPFPSR